MTVLELIQRGTDFLSQRGVESPRLQMELLLAHVLQMPRLKVYLNFERALTDGEAATLRDLVKRRGHREPLQHILGSACFCGLDLEVNRHVLVPRPETELLAEAVWKFLQDSSGLQRVRETIEANSSAGSPEQSILDIGTGSGCVAIAVAAQCPAVVVHAVDISPDALAVARRNAQRYNMVNRITFHSGDAFRAVPPGESLDVIVSNPPYIPTKEIETLEPEVREHDPRLALDGGADGLEFHQRLAGEAAAFLKPGGRLMAEFGDGQAGAICALFEQNGWQIERVQKDYSGRDRILLAQREV